MENLLNKVSIGVDLVEISRFELIERDFACKVFTKKELKRCKNKENLAGCFAAKEAVRKTIEENIEFNKIEIIKAKDGSPKVNFLDKKIKNKYSSIISITHTKDLAEAICLTRRN